MSLGLFLGIVATLLNVPNFDAKLVGQECNCAINSLLGDLDIQVEVSELLLSIWILIPAVVFSGLAVIIFFTKPKWVIDRRKYVEGLKRAAVFGEVFGLIVVGIIITEASISENIIVYPTPDPGDESMNIAENFEFTLLNGTRVNLYDFAGKPMLLEFMWTKCPHCQKKTEDLKELHNLLGSNITLISVAVTWGKDDIAKLQSFNDQYSVDWISGVDGGQGTDRYGVEAVPLMLVIDKEWNIRYIHGSEVSVGQLILELQEVLEMA